MASSRSSIKTRPLAICCDGRIRCDRKRDRWWGSQPRGRTGQANKTMSVHLLRRFAQFDVESARQLTRGWRSSTSASGCRGDGLSSSSVSPARCNRMSAGDDPGARRRRQDGRNPRRRPQGRDRRRWPKAVAVFKDNAIEADRLRGEQNRAAQRAEAERKPAMRQARRHVRGGHQGRGQFGRLAGHRDAVGRAGDDTHRRAGDAAGNRGRRFGRAGIGQRADRGDRRPRNCRRRCWRSAGRWSSRRISPARPLLRRTAPTRPSRG